MIYLEEELHIGKNKNESYKLGNWDESDEDDLSVDNVDNKEFDYRIK